MERERNTGARIGSAIANIAAGAATGGAPGAVVGAVKSFWPELAKGFIVLLCALILLPFVILCALPNILFGFDSAQAEDIIAVNNQANIISTYYGDVDAATQARVDELINLAVEENTDENGDPVYDALEVDTKLGAITPNWFIAINSVRHQQDLFSMSKPSIMEVVHQKVYSVWRLIARTVGEGPTSFIMWILRIEVRERTPDALMTLLGFTQEQKNWATTIHDTLEDDQIVDTGGLGGGYDFSDFVFEEVDTPVVYFNQLDMRWCNNQYGPKDTIGAAGCGPTALAMAVATFVDPTISPVDVADWAAENGQCCPGHGSYHSIITAGATHYGLGVEGIGRDARKLVDALNQGDLVIALMAKGHFTSGGHFIVLRGTTADGQILVADPASTKRSNQTWDLSIFTMEARRDAGAGGPFWVISKP